MSSTSFAMASPACARWLQPTAARPAAATRTKVDSDAECDDNGTDTDGDEDNDDELSDEEKQRIAEEDAERAHETDGDWRSYHLRHRPRKAFTMDRSERLQSIVKQAGGLTALCKRIVRDGSSGSVTEAELTGLIVAAAKQAEPGLTEAQAFTKIFDDRSEAGEAMRRAVTIAKALLPENPRQVGGAEARREVPFPWWPAAFR
jgi:hypothetical protein